MRCDLKTTRECPCCDEQVCQQEPIRITAPAIRFTVREQFFVMLMLVAFMTTIGWAALSRADYAIKVQDLDRQEAIAWKR